MKPTKKYICEYDVSNLDLTMPDVLRWYLERKIQYGDWSAIDIQILKKELPHLKIDKYLKNILFQFLKKYG